ncbi:unnamed protein product [Trifolium pratense]|uniref:Uncharacterized protein n=1 Tax=Trifolium pratense TaxID=57577 RepID=A0ACB0LA24_TRIPR|nr:unnamed protein product [Trifolium pratense]
MGKIIVSLVLILLVVAMFVDGYGAEGVGTPKKEDDVYNSQKFGQCIDCIIFYNWCLLNPFLWPTYHHFCLSNGNNIAPTSSEALP